MNIDIQSDPEQERPRPPMKPPTDFTSRTIRLRLMMLFGMLVVVLLLMHEARKPERWEWMGFGQVQPDNGEARQKGQADTSKPDNTAGHVDSDPAGDVDRSTQNEMDPAIQSQAADADYPVEATRFWTTTFAELKTDQRKTLFEMLKFVRSGKSNDIVPAVKVSEFGKLRESIARKRVAFHNQLFNQISLLDDASDEKKVLNQNLFESKEIWNEKIHSALVDAFSEEGINIAQQKAIERLQRLMDKLAYGLVADGETLKRPAEGIAWLRIWEQLLDDQPEQPQPVKHIELTSQPTAFRGRPVRISGWIRSARKLKVPTNELGINQYYVLWMRPADTKLGPFCVYSLELPRGFPHITGDSMELNEPATVDGRFFKIHSFKDRSQQMATCPLVLANTFQWTPVQPDPIAAIDNWQPPRWLIIAAFVAMPIFATFIAWFAYRNTRMQHFVPGQKTQKKIQRTLVGLSDDPVVQTEQEKVQSLYQMDQSEFESELRDEKD